MPRLERFLVPRAQRHHRRHVDFIEGRQQRRRLLRFDQASRDRRAALRHALARFARASRVTTAALATRAATACGPARRGALAAARWAAARSTSAFVTRGPGRLTDDSATSVLARPFAPTASRHVGRCFAAGSSPSARSAGAACVPVVPVGPVVPVVPVVPGFHRLQARRRSSRPRRAVRDRLQHARLRRGDLDVHLVRFELDERLAGRTASPSFFSHCATRASTIDSPTSGTTIFMDIDSNSELRCLRRACETALRRPACSSAPCVSSSS